MMRIEPEELANVKDGQDGKHNKDGDYQGGRVLELQPPSLLLPNRSMGVFVDFTLMARVNVIVRSVLS